MQLNKRNNFTIKSASRRPTDVVLKDRKLAERPLGRVHTALSVSEKYASASSLFLLFIPLILIPVIFCALSDILTPTTASATIFTAISTSGESISTSSSGDVQLNLVPTASGGFIMGKETLNIKTNATNGYQAYISTPSSDQNLYLNGDSSSTALPATNHDYGTPSAIDTNSWGYAVPQSDNTDLESHNLFTSTDYDITDYATQERTTTWAGVPAKSDIQLIQSTSSANNTTGVDLNIYYAAKANSLQSAGIYSGEVLYTILAKNTSATGASITPSTIDNLNGNNVLTVNIGINTPYASNLTNSTITIGDKLCPVTGGGNSSSDGTLYLTCTDQKQDATGRYDVTITVSDGTNNYGTYYIGSGVEYRTEYAPYSFYTITYMQEMSSSVCNSVKTPTSTLTAVTQNNGSDYADNGTNATIVPSTTLIDQRDGQSYTVRKLADGNCWMTENLRIGKEGAITLTSDNSNMTSGRTFALTAAVSASQAGTWGNQDAKTIAIYVNNNEKLDASGTEGAPLNTVLYNWYTATAGARDSSGNSLMTATSGQAADSVCPKNWQLPINEGDSGTGKSFSHLVRIYTGNGGNRNGNTSGQTPESVQFDLAKLHASPTSFVYSDLYNYSNGTLSSRSFGYWWSSTVGSAINSYSLYLDNYNSPYYLAPQYNNNKGYALALRCVLAS